MPNLVIKLHNYVRTKPKCKIGIMAHQMEKFRQIRDRCYDIKYIFAKNLAKMLELFAQTTSSFNKI
jgi:hypothetical protein